MHTQKNILTPPFNTQPEENTFSNAQPLQPQHIDIVKQKIPLLASAGTAITEHFYQRLFSYHPELQHIFNMGN